MHKTDKRPAGNPTDSAGGDQKAFHSADTGDGLTSLPTWARDLILSKVQGREHTRGRILRVKLGYNPNSSSVGSGVYVLPVLLLGIATLFGAVAGLISSALSQGRSGHPRDKSVPTESSQKEE